MATKPSSTPRWANSGGAVVEPTSGKKDVGWVVGEKPPAQYLNWIHKLSYEWFEYLSDGIFAGKFGLGSTISPSAISGTTNDWNPTSLSTAAVIRVDLSADATLTGISGGDVNRVLVLVNVDPTFNLFLRHDDGASSTAANRFTLPDSADMLLRPGKAAILLYDSTSSRWRYIGGNAVSKRTCMFAGHDFEALTETLDFDRIIAGSLTSNSASATSFNTGLSLPVGTLVTDITGKIKTSGGGGTRQLKLVSSDWDNETGSDTTTLASASTTTTSTLITLTIASTMPQALSSVTKRYSISWQGVVQGDVLLSARMEYYPA